MNPNNIIEQWLRRIHHLKVAHFQAASYCDRSHLLIGLPLIALSAAIPVVSAAFAVSGASSTIAAQISIWGLGLTAAVLASLQTFLRHGERAEGHHTAGTRYASLELDVERFSNFPSPSQQNTEQFFKELTDRWKILTEQGPRLPQKIWRQVAPHVENIESTNA